MSSSKGQLQIAHVVEDLTQSDDGPSKTTNIDKKILDTLSKCFARAEHPTASESEAQTAMKMSSRIMDQYNLTRADVLAAQADAGEPSTLTGEASVDITHPDKARKLIWETWTFRLDSAIRLMFNCKSYKTALHQRKKYRWTFYGVAENASAAAMAFEVVHNITQEWSLTRAEGSKNSYRHGIVAGILRLAKNEKQELEVKARQEEREEKAALAQREKEEDAARQREIDRLQNAHTDSGAISPRLLQATVEDEEDLKDEDGIGSSPFRPSQFGGNSGGAGGDPDDDVYPDSDDEYDDGDVWQGFADDPTEDVRPTLLHTDDTKIDVDADFEEELKRHMPKAPEVPVVPVNGLSEEAQREKDKERGLLPGQAGALVRIHRSALELADQYIKDKNMKFRRGRKRKWNIVDEKAYKQGKEDSKDIDVRRRRIENGSAEDQVVVKKENEQVARRESIVGDKLESVDLKHANATVICQRCGVQEVTSGTECKQCVARTAWRHPPTNT